MLRLAVIVRDPAAATAIIGFGVVLLAVVAAMSLALWVVVARGKARRDVEAFDDSENDPGLDALRRQRLVVEPSRTPDGRDGPIVAKLEPVGGSDPAPR